MSLNSCLLKHHHLLRDFDTSEIRESAKAHIDEGKSEQEAALLAIDEKLEEVAAESARVEKDIAAQYSAMRTDRAAKPATAKPESVQDKAPAAKAKTSTPYAGKLDDTDKAGDVLTGSDRAADGNANQGDIFGQQSNPKPAEPTSASTGAASVSPPETAKQITDFGGKLDGARKDLVASLKTEFSDDDIATQPLSKIWPSSEIDKIDDQFVAAVAFAARAEVPAKPRVGYKVKQWVQKVKAVRSIALFALDGTMTKGELKTRFSDFRGLAAFKDKVALLELIDRNQWKRIGEVEAYPHAYRNDADGQQVPPPSVAVVIDGKRIWYEGATEVSEVMDRVNEALGVAPKAKPMKFTVRGREGAYYIHKDGDSEYRHLKEFTESRAALDYVKGNHTDLVAAWEQVKERDNVKETDVRGKENRPRTAQDWRGGKDVSAEKFHETFGFRGTQFGNWMKQGGSEKERQGALNAAFDALMDLADIVGVPPKALSLNGELGMAFGARGSGSGKASAHYEPGVVVINLTKTRGAGTLAHEWFHALDNYFRRTRDGGEGNGRDDRYITYRPEAMYVRKGRTASAPMTKAQLDARHAANPTIASYDPQYWEKDPNHPEGVRPEVEAKFAELVQALNDSPMTKRSNLIDKGKVDGYWSRIIERAARSFENYVIAKMAEQGYNNDYLANVEAIDKFKRDMGRYPYLKDDELAPVVEAFDNLFGTIQTKETDTGTAMFIRGTEQPALYSQLSRSVESVQKTVDALTADWKNAPPIVIASGMNDPAIPQMARDVDAKQKSQGADGEPDGFIYQGTVYLIAGQLKTDGDVARVLAHEALGHAGLRGLYGEALTPILKQIAFVRSKDVAAKAKQYGLDTKKEADRLIAAEEVLAEMAQSQPELGFVKRAIAAIRQWLRAHGLKLDLTDADIIANYLLPARAFIENGGKPGGAENAAPAFMLGDSLTSKVWRMLAGDEYLFQNPMPDSFDMEGAAKEIDPGMSAVADKPDLDEQKTGIAKKWYVKMPDGTHAYVMENKQGEVWLDASRLSEGASGGTKLYLLVGSYAEGNGKVFIGDPAGLSDVALIRRTENMLSLALRFGKTDFLRPHEYQMNPDAKLNTVLADVVRPLEWVDGDSANNIEELLKTSYANAIDLLPEVKDVGYNFDKQRFERDGAEFTDFGGIVKRGIDSLLERGLSKIIGADRGGVAGKAEARPPIGIATLKRAAVLNTVARAARSGRGGELLAEIGRVLPGGLKGTPLEGVLYSRTNQTESGVSAGGLALKQFSETEARLGGVDAYDKEKAAGKTELDYTQWVLVRTPNFKRWWGYDWEQENSDGRTQEVVGREDSGAGRVDSGRTDASINRGRAIDGGTDEVHPGVAKGFPFVHPKTGEPRVFYHGTRDEFTEFDVNHPNKKDAGWLGRGHYVTSDIHVAGIYSLAKRGGSQPTVMTLFVRPVNPFLALPTHKKIIRNYTPDQLSKFNEKLRSFGHSGVATLHLDGVLELAMFDANSIKSATDNVGTFSESNDIRFSRGQQPIPGTVVPQAQQVTAQPPLNLPPGVSGNQASWDAPENTGFDSLIYKLQNKNIDLKRVIEAVRKSGKVLADMWNPYLQEELFHGRSAKRTLDFVERELNPLLRKAQSLGLTLGEIDGYLHARHAEEANNLIAQRDPNMQDGGSGMTTADARAYLAGLSSIKRSGLADVAAKVDVILAATRQLYTEYGLESQDTIDEWGAMFKHYVPLMREDMEGGMGGLGQGISIKGKEVKHRTGSTRAVVDILANIAMQREKVVVRGEKNRVAVSLMGLAKLNPNPDFWTFDKVPSERVLNEKTGLIETRVDPMFKSRANVIVAKVRVGDGRVEERAVVFNERNERAARMSMALKNMDVAQLEGIMGVSAKITRYFSSINTQYNPVFGFVNLTRDVQGAMLNLNTTALKDHKAEILSHTFSALSGIYRDARAERKGGAGTSKWSALWEEFTSEGGQTGYRDLFATSEDRANQIKRTLNPLAWMESSWGKAFTAGGVLKVPLAIAQERLAKPLFDWLSDFNLTMENAIRLSAYKVALEQGMSKQQAASLAKNLTVNFNRKGQAGQQAGALYAFFNAAMQGTARIAETVTTMEPGQIKTLRLSKVGKTIVGGGVLLGAMQAVLLAAMGFDDDEPPEFVRERNVIIPIGGKDYITIPMPLGYHAIPNVGRVLTEIAMDGGKGVGKRVFGLFGTVVEAFNPLGGTMSLQTISPTAIDPFVALGTNTDWTGKPISREDFSSLEKTPGFTRAKDTASGISKALAEAINYATGGTDYTPGVYSPTPDEIDYLWGQVTGGVGRELNKAATTAGALYSGEDLPTHKVPLLGRYYGSSEGAGGQAAKFYANLKESSQHYAEIKGRLLDGLPVDEYMNENPGAQRAAMTGKAFNQQVSKLRKVKRQLVENGAPRSEVKEIEARITETMGNFNSMVAEAED